MSTGVDSPRAQDVLSVRSRVSWAAIFAGAMVSLSIYFLLTLLGVALGLEVAMRRGTDSLGAGTAIYSIFALLISMFFGGWATSRLAVGESKLEAVLYGLILWGLLFVGMFWLVGQGVRIGFGAMAGLASGAVTIADDAVAVSGTNASDLSARLVDRYNTDLSSENFVADLKRLGIEDDQARKIQQTVHERVERFRSDPASVPAQVREMANDPEVRQKAAAVADTTRAAAWYTLLGVFVSMASVIVGSLVGSGDLPVPVPVLGVRRMVPPPARA